jgi:hypothetical protein
VKDQYVELLPNTTPTVFDELLIPSNVTQISKHAFQYFDANVGGCGSRIAKAIKFEAGSHLTKVDDYAFNNVQFAEIDFTNVGLTSDIYIGIESFGYYRTGNSAHTKMGGIDCLIDPSSTHKV